jgi:hypothetical protein
LQAINDFFRDFRPGLGADVQHLLLFSRQIQPGTLEFP